jgi:hypothetical protein
MRCGIPRSHPSATKSRSKKQESDAENSQYNFGFGNLTHTLTIILARREPKSQTP